MFLSLSMDQLSHEFDKIATMLGKEHVVKSAILEAYEMAVLGGTETGRPTTYQTRRGINQMVKESGHLGGSRSNKEAVDTMTVYIATWTLEPEIDGTAIPTLLSMVRDEMKAVGYSVTLRLLILLDTAGTITYLLIPCGYFNVVHCGVMVTGWIPLGGESLDSLAIRLGHILA